MSRAADEIDDAFLTIGIVIRAKINVLCNENQFDKAHEIQDAYDTINKYFDDKLTWKQTEK